MASLKLHSYLVALIPFILRILNMAAIELSHIDKFQEPSKSEIRRQDWPNYGGDLYNRRYANEETKISPSTVSSLSLKWAFYAGGDITVSPAIYEGTLYFPSWNRNLYAVKASDGSLVWKKNLQKLTGFNNTGFILNVNSTISRSTPTVAAELLIVGIYGPAIVIAVKRSNGDLVWSTKLDDHPRSFITMSGTYYRGSFYVGTSSLEGVTLEKCCTLRGSFSKLDASTGQIIRKTFMLPDNLNKTGQYAGAAIWGSRPAIDINRALVNIATGNLYSAPPHVLESQERENNQTTPSEPDKCIEPENHSNSILGLDLDSRNMTWYNLEAMMCGSELVTGIWTPDALRVLAPTLTLEKHP